MHRYHIETLLIGGDSEVRKWGLGGAVGMFVLGLGIWGVLWIEFVIDISIPIDWGWFFSALAILSIAPAAVYGYQNDGLLDCWVLGTAIPIALYLGPAVSGIAETDQTALWTLWEALAYGILAGTIGFLLGVGARFLVRNVRTKSLPNVL